MFSGRKKALQYHAEHRHATWLELFFDLVFVVVVAKVTHLLAHTHHGHLTGRPICEKDERGGRGVALCTCRFPDRTDPAT